MGSRMAGYRWRPRHGLRASVARVPGGRVISRVVWLATGAAAGAYATVKARRAAYRLSAPGIADQAAAAKTGWREFKDEVADGMAAKEQQQLNQFTRKQIR